MIDTSEYYGGKYPSPDEKEEKYQYVELECTVRTYVKVPDGFELRMDAKKWIEDNYDFHNNKSENYIFEDPNTEVYIDEIKYEIEEW